MSTLCWRLALSVGESQCRWWSDTLDVISRTLNIFMDCVSCSTWTSCPGKLSSGTGFVLATRTRRVYDVRVQRTDNICCRK